jgi:hypothetical protein
VWHPVAALTVLYSLIGVLAFAIKSAAHGGERLE